MQQNKTHLVKRASDGLVTGLGVVLLVMMMAIVAQVIASRMGINTLISWDRVVFLFGKGITLNSLIELHWYLLAMLVLLPLATIWVEDIHVRVDFIYTTLGTRMKAVVDLVGHAIFTLPFLIMCLPSSWKMTQVALARGERSQDDGLMDRFLVKGMIPMGFTLLLLVILWEVPGLLRRVRHDKDDV